VAKLGGAARTIDLEPHATAQAASANRHHDVLSTRADDSVDRQHPAPCRATRRAALITEFLDPEAISSSETAPHLA
jgi:hypothetical protein